MKYLVSIFALLTVHCHAAALHSKFLNCSVLIKSLSGNESSIRDIWSLLNETTPIEIETSTGKGILTYSHDTEPSGSDWVRYIQKDAEGSKKLDALAGTFKIEEAAKILNMSIPKTKSFAIKRGVVTDKETPLKLSDFHPTYGAHLLNARDENLPMGSKVLISALPIFTEVLRKNGIQDPTHRDVTALELNHPSYEETPKKALEFIDRLFTDFKTPSMHLHLGLPKAAISEKQALAITQVLETYITIDRILHYDSISPLLYSGSALSGETGIRGVVKIQLQGEETFKKPAPAYDLEIRQYGNPEDAIFLLGLASILAKNAQHLRVLDYKPLQFGSFHSDKLIGNFRDTLNFAGILFGQFNDTKNIAETLLRKKSIDVKNVTEKSKSDLKKLRIFLEENTVLEKLSDWRLYIKEKP